MTGVLVTSAFQKHAHFPNDLDCNLKKENNKQLGTQNIFFLNCEVIKV